MSSEVLKGLKCQDCGDGVFFKPVMACRSCSSRNLTEIQISDKGKIYTFTSVLMGFGELKDKVPYCIGVVELDAGAKILTHIEDIDIEKIKIDDPVIFKYYNPEGIPIFSGKV